MSSLEVRPQGIGTVCCPDTDMQRPGVNLHSKGPPPMASSCCIQAAGDLYTGPADIVTAQHCRKEVNDKTSLSLLVDMMQL